MRAQRNAFTLVEMLVVIAVISILAGILVPAVNMARESARKSACLNNIRQCALGLILYEKRKGRFPGYVNHVGSAGNIPVGWSTLILPDVEKSDIWDVYQGAAAPASPPYVEVFVCSSFTPTVTAPISYVANSGIGEPEADPDKLHNFYNGIFMDYITNNPNTMFQKPTLDNIYDGSGNTLLLSENVQAGSYSIAAAADPKEKYLTSFCWWATPTAAELLLYKINGNKDVAVGSDVTARPSSWHKGGVNVAFADGRAMFLSDTIAYSVYTQLCTSNSSKSDAAGDALDVLDESDF